MCLSHFPIICFRKMHLKVTSKNCSMPVQEVYQKGKSGKEQQNKEDNTCWNRGLVPNSGNGA